MSNWINEVQDWNETRDNLMYSPSLEYSMLDEELGEYMEAGTVGNRVGQADALGDLLVVVTGALYKLCGGDKEKFDDIMLAITAANNLKSATKNAAGKITKPANFVGPEELIGLILDEG